MPCPSGLEILSTVWKMCPHALISGHFPEDIPEETAHCEDFRLEKPVKLKALTALIESARSIRSELDSLRMLDSFDRKSSADSPYVSHRVHGYDRNQTLQPCQHF